MKPALKIVLPVLATLCSLTGCQSRTAEPAAPNRQARLSDTLPYNPLGWKVVTSWTNQKQGTMSTLYGNDVAVAHARSSSDQRYPAGSVLGLVTWSQRDDPHWFGAKIPSAAQSVEFVTFPPTAGGPAGYERYQGSPLSRAVNIDPDSTQRRIDSIVSQRAAVMP
jgi:hypothetical protein